MTDKENKMRKDVSVRLMMAADARDKSMSQVARNVNMSSRSLYNYCYGTMPKLFTFFLLCEYLGVSADWMLGRTDEMEVKK